MAAPHQQRDDAAGQFDDEEIAEAPNPYASKSRWHHQESSKFARHASAAASSHHPQAREAEARGRVNELADFLNKTRITPAEAAAAAGHDHPPGSSASNAEGGRPKFTPVVIGAAEAREATGNTDHPDIYAAAPEPASDGRDVACGPLLNFRRMELGCWFGSVLVVTRGGGATQPFVPTLMLRRLGERYAHPNGVATTKETAAAPSAAVGPEKVPAETEKNGEGDDDDAAKGTSYSKSVVVDPEVEALADVKGAEEVKGYCLYSDPRNTFWRFDLDVRVEPVEVQWEYTLPGMRFHSRTKPQRSIFHVPAAAESMRIMFHSCNGFSVGTDEEAWSGPALWNDVLRVHERRPFHVMIGGGDQIYNDGIRVGGPLRKWTAISNPKKRRDHPYPESMRQECDDYYLKNYIRWYSTFPFANANGQIPQINIWDDHDIIDGFGSYTDNFMRCDVFRGIGGTAHKYYLLFQHHLPPPASTYTSDAPITVAPSSSAGNDATAQDSDVNQLMNTYVAPRMTESQYINGTRPGPYVAEHSHNIYARLGARIAFVGIDARTERTRHQINYPETYDSIFDRLRVELEAAKAQRSSIRHLIVLLGIPIAYPRLTWLENVFTSPIIGPIKFLNRRFGLGGGIFNHFDGSVDLLDDLDDHYTARTHKKERNQLIERFQRLSGEHSVRITILGGDVHLAAFGRFYSNPKLGIPVEHDHRYIANVVSSAIVNKPPPGAIANLLARRNKIHHLNHDTDETLLKLFDKDPGDSCKTAGFNHVTMPSRNFAVITENSPAPPHNSPPDGSFTHLTPPPSGSAAYNVSTGNSRSLAPPPGSSAGASATSAASSTQSQVPGKDGHYPISHGELNCGTGHRAAGEGHGTATDGSLDIMVRVEIDNSDKEGRTQAYGLSIPTLRYDPSHPVQQRTLAPAKPASRNGTVEQKQSVEPPANPPPPGLAPPINPASREALA